MENNKVLYIADVTPDLKNGHGNMIKMHHSIFSEIVGNNLISVFLYGDKVNAGDRQCFFPNNRKISRYLSGFLGYPPFLSLVARKYILEIIRENGITRVYIDNSISGKLIRDIKKINRDIRVMVYFPDIENVLLKKQMQGTTLSHKVSLGVLINNEKETVRYSDYNIVLNGRDGELFQKIYNKDADCMIPIVVPDPFESDYAEMHEEKETLKILFVGVDYEPNVEGIRWFINYVAPKLTFDWTLSIVGMNMERHRKEWGNEHINVIGTVENISDYYEICDVVIGPIFDGGGMKVKTAEALSFGKKFVGLPECLEGYWEDVWDEIKNNGIYCSSNEDEFAESLRSLWNTSYKRRDDDIIRFMKKTYSYSAVKKKYREAIEEGLRYYEY